METPAEKLILDATGASDDQTAEMVRSVRLAAQRRGIPSVRRGFASL